MNVSHCKEQYEHNHKVYFTVFVDFLGVPSTGMGKWSSTFDQYLPASILMQLLLCISFDLAFDDLLLIGMQAFFFPDNKNCPFLRCMKTFGRYQIC